MILSIVVLTRRFIRLAGKILQKNIHNHILGKFKQLEKLNEEDHYQRLVKVLKYNQCFKVVAWSLLTDNLAILLITSKEASTNTKFKLALQMPIRRK